MMTTQRAILSTGAGFAAAAESRISWAGRRAEGALNTARLCYRVLMDAFYRFNSDDGWAIASHIAL